MGIILHDLVDGNTGRLDALTALFTACFPQYSAAAPQLAQKAGLPANANPHFVAHQWLAEIDGQAAGLFSFKYAPGRDLGLAVYLAVAAAWRAASVDGLPLSAWLIRAGLRRLAADAAAAGRPAPAGIFFEVEPPRLVARYREFGFAELPVVYHEPRFSRPRSAPGEARDLDQVTFQRTHFGVFPADDAPDDPTDPEIVARAVLAFMHDHYGLPETHWAVARALSSIGRPDETRGLQHDR